MFIEAAPATDAMPREVAIELLCSHKGLTNRIRKNALEAMTKRYQSTLVPKPRQLKLVDRIGRGTLAQLIRWRRRAAVQRRRVQRAFQRAMQRHADLLIQLSEKPDSDTPTFQAERMILERNIAALELRAGQLDEAEDVIITAFKLRNIKV